MRELFRGDCRRTTGRGAAPRLLPLLLLLTQEWILPPTTMMMTTTTAWTMIRPMPRRGYSTIGSMMQRHQQRVWLLAAEQNSALDSNNGGIVTATDDFLNKDVVDEDGKDEDGVDDVTYYSPNVPLGESRWSSEESIIPTDENVVLGGGDSTNEYSFFDEAVITVRAGSGGQGSATFKKSKVGQDGLADGGNGGRGGNVWLVTDASLNTLAGLTNAWRPNSFGGAGAAAATTVQPPKNFRAENGGDGGRMYNNGRFGGDVIIRVPPGTVVQEQIFDKETGELLRTVDLGTLAAGDGNEEQHHDGERFSYSSKSLGSSESRILVARGGDGGEGSAAAGKHRGVRRPREGSRGGQRKILMLTLKIVADVALVGVPNAGKSTFLAAVTRYDLCDCLFVFGRLGYRLWNLLSLHR